MSSPSPFINMEKDLQGGSPTSAPAAVVPGVIGLAPELATHLHRHSWRNWVGASCHSAAIARVLINGSPLFNPAVIVIESCRVEMPSEHMLHLCSSCEVEL
ncbi:hypothetical protein GOP47_0006565 [Adiantum capillus-veneris]|uniref:Uncharacterized protein n=1 Tax=Adiantum capillus-veneris TaxID=13818 RepID=A0A9D4ZKI7_ADICA|nr:hypothetical protein GOP47_0006565 [Adiantum capillus-veneris]